MDIKVRVQTDDYPSETSWKLIDECGTEYPLSSPSYSSADVMRTTSFCLPLSQYTFIITDTEKDGLCCGFGKGWYEVLVDGTTVHTGGQFGSLEMKTFGSCPTSENPTTCAGMNVEVKIQTDNYPHETAWNVTNICETEINCKLGNCGAQPNLPCVFPFIYKGVTYYSCTDVDDYQEWCAQLKQITDL